MLFIMNRESESYCLLSYWLSNFGLKLRLRQFLDNTLPNVDVEPNFVIFFTFQRLKPFIGYLQMPGDSLFTVFFGRRHHIQLLARVPQKRRKINTREKNGDRKLVRALSNFVCVYVRARLRTCVRACTCGCVSEPR